MFIIFSEAINANCGVIIIITARSYNQSSSPNPRKNVPI